MSENESGSTQALQALLSFMSARGLKASTLAKKAGFSPSVIYNLKSGLAAAPSSAILERIAAAEGVTVADILAFGRTPSRTEVNHLVIAGGRITTSRTKLMVDRPPTIDPAESIEIAVVAGDGLHPIPPGWLVFFTAESSDPVTMVGELSVVRSVGQQDAVIGTVLEGATGTFDLQPWYGSTSKGIQIIAAHKILAIQPPAVSLE